MERKELKGIKLAVDKEKGQVKVTLDIRPYLNKEKLDLSASGKSYVLASTNGNIPIEVLDGVFLNVNLYVKKEKYQDLLNVKQIEEIKKELQEKKEEPKKENPSNPLEGVDPALLNAIVTLVQALKK